MAGDPTLDPRARSIPELLRDLADETAALVRQEIALARVELAENVKPVQQSAGMFAATAIFGVGAFGALTAFLIALLALALQVWAAALIVMVVYGIIAFVCLQNGRKQLAAVSQRPILPQTTATVKEDVAWSKTQLKSGGK